MEPTLPDPAARSLAPIPKSAAGAVMQLGKGGWCELKLDTTTGAIVHLAKSGGGGGGGGPSLAAAASPLLLVRYQTLVNDDFLQWQKEYILPGAGGGNEYGKPSNFMKGPDGQPIKKVLAPPTFRSAWKSSDGR